MIVRTKSELENAIKNKIQYFEVEGELAENIKKAQRIKNLGKFSLSALVASIAGIAAAPVTGGLTGLMGFSGVASVAALTGLEIAVIMAVAFVGSSILIALFKGYDVEIESDSKGKNKVKFTRKNEK